MKKKDCGCATECPDDRKCKCCTAAIGVAERSILMATVPRGRYTIYVPSHTGTTMRDVEITDDVQLTIDVPGQPRLAPKPRLK